MYFSCVLAIFDYKAQPKVRLDIFVHCVIVSSAASVCWNSVAIPERLLKRY